MTQPQGLPSADDLLTGGGGRRCKFGAIAAGDSPVNGTIHEGVVIGCESQQQTTYDPTDPSKSNKPKFWDNGKPAMELVITFQTAERDDQNDDGIRSVYAKGQLLAMIRESVKEAHAADPKVVGIRPGGYIKMMFVNQEKLPVRKNIFRAKYTPPAPSADDMFDQEPESFNHQGQPQPADPPAWAAEPATPTPATGGVAAAPASAGHRTTMLDRMKNASPSAPVTGAENADF